MGMDEQNGLADQTAIVARSSTGEPVRLFKNREQLIKANLVGVKTTALKKQIAQQHFYDDDDKLFKLENVGNRGPVHRRLGKQVLHQNYFLSYARRYNQFGLIHRRHVPYNYTQQGRLTRPREGIKLYTSHYMQSIPPKVLMRQNIRWLEQSNATQILQAAGRQENQDPMNYTIEVPNNKRTSVMSNAYLPPALRHSVHAQLNPILQKQIRSIQAEYLSVSLAPIEIIPTLTNGATKISMHDRFTSMG